MINPHTGTEPISDKSDRLCDDDRSVWLPLSNPWSNRTNWWWLPVGQTQRKIRFFTQLILLPTWEDIWITDEKTKLTSANRVILSDSHSSFRVLHRCAVATCGWSNTSSSRNKSASVFSRLLPMIKDWTKHHFIVMFTQRRYWIIRNLPLAFLS